MIETRGEYDLRGFMTTTAQESSLESVLGLIEKIAEHHTLPDLMGELARGLNGVAGTDVVSILLHDATTDRMKPYVLGGKQSERSEELRKVIVESSLDETPSGHVWRTQEPAIVADWEKDTKFPRFRDFIATLGFRSSTVLPLTTPRQRLGTIAFVRERAGGSDASELAIFQTVAKHVALAVEGALHLERAEELGKALAEERDRLRAHVDVNRAIGSELDLAALLSAIGDALRQTVPHDFVSLGVRDGDGFLLHKVVQSAEGESHLKLHTCTSKDAPWAVAAATGKPFVKNDFPALAPHLEEHRRKFLEQLGIQSLAAIPLVSRGRPFGALCFASVKANAFDLPTVDLLMHVTSPVASAVDNALAYGEIARLKDKLAQEKLYLEGELAHDFHEIVGESAEIKRVLKAVETVAPTDSTVLVLGETGTGKELIARAIHNLSGRKKGTFIKLNCAAIPSGLLESELFGHEKGAFTGALAQRIGRFELADGGTLFLDEVGDVPPELQAKLLRVLQEQEFERLGGTKTIKVNVRLVAATNRDLAQMVADRTFRSDLYFRLNVFPVSLPPLRQRPGDVELLVRHFVEKFARKMSKKIDSIPSETMAALRGYAWPGNVRELENVIERAMILSEGASLAVPVADLRAAPVPASMVARPTAAPPPAASSAEAATLAEVERAALLRALEESRWQVGGPKGAAAKLGLSRTTLQGKMKRFGLSKPGSP
ncbi:MAG TPA: sigma 54-interacting transcriptional regulator [Planctomycetota bacterium]|nr:sigma 54-interacting transcriptional regulator [Planctomycetota bacterium]